MSIHIDQVLDYLDSHLVCRNADSMESLMETLRDAYSLHNTEDTQELRKLFRQLRPIMDRLSLEDADSLFEAVSILCLKHEQVAFSQGVLTGMLLMTEVNRLP